MPPPVSQGVAPRAQAATEEFEVVAALEGKKLVVYLDRFASNEPVTKPRWRVEGGGLKGRRQRDSPRNLCDGHGNGLPPGKHPLTIHRSRRHRRSADGDAGYVTAAAMTSMSTAGASGSSGSLPALLLAAGALLAVRRRKKVKGI
jgi:MYXO-CTERM domain-containing protein